MIERKYLLVLGNIHSGSTLLAAMLGRHPEINMLNECLDGSNLRLIGKLYCGNKIGIRQIGFKHKANLLGLTLNRITSLWGRFNFRIWPNSSLSLKDCYDIGTKIVVIIRADEKVISSNVNRQRFPLWFAKWHTKWMNKKVDKIVSLYPVRVVNFEHLVLEPREVMSDILEYLDLEYDDRVLDGPKYNYVYPNDRILTEKA